MPTNKTSDPYPYGGFDGFGRPKRPEQPEQPEETPTFREYPWLSLGVAGETEYTIRMSLPEFHYVQPDAMRHKIIGWVLQALHQHHSQKQEAQREIARLQALLHEQMSEGVFPPDVEQKMYSEYWPERYRK